MKWLMTGLFYCLALKMSFSQNSDEIWGNLHPEESVVLLKNENHILPFQRLDTLRAAVITFDEVDLSAFTSSIDRYQHLPHLRVS